MLFKIWNAENTKQRWHSNRPFESCWSWIPRRITKTIYRVHMGKRNTSKLHSRASKALFLYGIFFSSFFPHCFSRFLIYPTKNAQIECFIAIWLREMYSDWPFKSYCQVKILCKGLSLLTVIVVLGIPLFSYSFQNKTW